METYDMKYALVMTRKYASSDNTWSRAFGPFDTRSKALGFKAKQIRHVKREYLWDDARVAQEFKWQVIQLWSGDWGKK